MRIKTNKISKILLVVLIASSYAFAQKPNYKFSSIKESDGLIYGTVHTLFEDSFGFVWIGTQKGLQRYDGITFKNFKYVIKDSTGLWHNSILKFYEDPEHNIWIITVGGINRYIRKTGKIERIVLKDDILLKNKGSVFYDLTQDQVNKDIIWLIGHGLVRLNTSTLESIFYKVEGVSLSYANWVRPHPLDNSKLLMGSDKLLSFDKKKQKFVKLWELKQNSDIPNNLINKAVVDPTNNEILWLATGDFMGSGSLGGLIKYNLNTNRRTLYSQENRPYDIPDLHLLTLCFDGDGNLWIGTRDKGLLLFNKKEDRFYNYKNNKLNNESFVTARAVLSIIEDRSGTLWFGTWGEGISLLSKGTQKFTHYKYIPNDPTRLLDNDVNTFTEDADGNIWIGTTEGGLSKFNPRTKTFDHYFHEFISADDNSINIRYLFYDSRDNLWIGTYKNALYRFNPKTGVKKHYKKGNSNKNITQKRITAISEIKQGEILISTYSGGLNIYDYETDSFKHFMHDPKDSTSIPGNQVWLPLKGDDGYYYFSGRSYSLIKFNPITEKFLELDSTDILSSFSMPVKNSKGNFYINDANFGLKELIIGDKIVANSLFDINGNPIDGYVGIQIDSGNKLWLGTNNGLIEYDPESKILRKYDPDDGIQSYEFNIFSAFKASSGEMYFGGNNGFNVFYPNEINLSDFEPNIVFVDLKLFQESVLIGDESVLPESILTLDELVLNYDQNDFSISFAALDFSNPNKIMYKYILKSHDESWIDAGNKSYASYTNMDPGEYTLKVLATNSDGIWLKEAKTVSIIIKPPFWKTTVAYFIYGVMLILSVFGIDRFQRRRLLTKAKERMKMQDAEHRAETAELQAKAAEAQSKVIQIENERKTKELEEARELQLSMLPKDLPNLPNLDIAVYMQTATEVGGDYYDFSTKEDGSLNIAIGDATGHGMKAGTLVSMMKSIFTVESSKLEIDDFFFSANQGLKKMSLGKMMMAFAMVNLSNNKIKISNAGIPPIFIFRKNKNSIEEINLNGLPLGAMKNSNYNVYEDELSVGDTILMLSDGMPELQNAKKEMYGYDRTINEFHSVGEKEPKEIVSHLKNSASHWVDGKDPDDDVTFVVIKMK